MPGPGEVLVAHHLGARTGARNPPRSAYHGYDAVNVAWRAR